MREKQVPVDVVEMKGKNYFFKGNLFTFFPKRNANPDAFVRLVSAEGIIAFAWEPNGSKFAVLHGESPRINVSFYHVKNNGKIELTSEWIRLMCKLSYRLSVPWTSAQAEPPLTGKPLFLQRRLTSSRPTASSGAPRDSFWCWLDSGGQLNVCVCVCARCVFSGSNKEPLMTKQLLF